MDVAMTQHVKERTVRIEIFGVHNSVIDLEVRGCSVRDTVPAAGQNSVQNS